LTLVVELTHVVGVEWRLANGLSFMVKADSEWGNHTQTYTGTGRIRYTW